MKNKLFIVTIVLVAGTVLSTLAFLPPVRRLLKSDLSITVYNYQNEIILEDSVKYGSDYSIPSSYLELNPKTYVKESFHYSLNGWDSNLKNIKQALRVFPKYDSELILDVTFENVLYTINGIKEKYNNQELTELIIPGTILHQGRYKRLVEIKHAAFENNNYLHRVEILPYQNQPEARFVLIRDKVFSNMKSIEEVIFSKDVKQVQNSVFIDCPNLKKVVFNAKTLTIGDENFRNCTSLEEIILPESLTEINMRSFFNCKSLTNIGYLKSLQRIGTDIFNGCTNLEWFIIPETIKNISVDSFRAVNDQLQIFIEEDDLLDDVTIFPKGWNNNGTTNLTIFPEGTWVFDVTTNHPLPKVE